MSADPYTLMPFEPEPIEAMVARFPAALCQIPTPPTRQHTFDFDSNIRLIASLEYGLPHGPLIHLSFGVPPWNCTIGSAIEMQTIARKFAVQFVGLKQEVDTYQTRKAFHLFYLHT